MIQFALKSVLFSDKLANWTRVQMTLLKSDFCNSRGTAVTLYRWSGPIYNFLNVSSFFRMFVSKIIKIGWFFT